MRLPSEEIVFTMLEQEFPQFDVEILGRLTDYMLNFADEHRELDDWEKVVLYVTLVTKGIKGIDWAGGDHVKVCARLLGWDYVRAENSFVAAKGLDLIDKNFLGG